MTAKPSRILNTFLFEVTRELLELDHLRGALNFECLVNDLMQMISDLQTIQKEYPDPMLSVSIVAVQKTMKKFLLNMPVNCINLEDDFMHHYLYTNISRLIRDPVLLNITESNQPDDDHENTDKKQLQRMSKTKDYSSQKSTNPLRHRNNNHVKSITNVYSTALIQYTGRHKIIFVMNFRNRPGFLKGDEIYKMVDDFRKIKYFEIDCAPSSRDFKTTFGAVRQMIPCNDRLAGPLNGGTMCIQDLNLEAWKKIIDFSSITRPNLLGLRAKSGIITYPRMEDFPSCIGSLSPQRGVVPDLVPVPGFLKPFVIISDFEQLYQLRYSCGWKIDTQSIVPGFPWVGTSNPPDLIKFEYHMFDVHLIQELRRIQQTTIKEQPGSEMEPLKADQAITYKVTLYQPNIIKDGKHNVYDVIRTELMEWDDILELCNSLTSCSNDEELVTVIRKNHRNSAKNLMKQLTDQKCTKLFLTKYKCLVRCDTAYYQTGKCRFVDDTRTLLSNYFKIALNNKFLIKKIGKELLLCSIEQKSRNIILLGFHLFGTNRGLLNGEIDRMVDLLQADHTIHIWEDSLWKYRNQEVNIESNHFRIYLDFDHASRRQLTTREKEQFGPWDIPKGIFNKLISSKLSKHLLESGFVMLSSINYVHDQEKDLRGASVSKKKFHFHLNFIKQQIRYGKNPHEPEMVFYVKVKFTFSQKYLEKVSVKLLSKDPYMLLHEKIPDLGDTKLGEFQQLVNKLVEKYNELLMLHNLNIEHSLMFVQDRLQAKSTTIPFKLKTFSEFMQQKLTKGRQKEEEADRTSFELEKLRDYLSSLQSGKTKNMATCKVDIIALSKEVFVEKLEFIEINQVNNFKTLLLQDYNSILKEYSDHSFKLKNDRNTDYYSKFLFENLLVIMYIERPNTSTDEFKPQIGSGGVDVVYSMRKSEDGHSHSQQNNYKLRILINCLRCLSTSGNYEKCHYLQAGKNIWIHKVQSQLKRLMQKAFMRQFSLKIDKICRLAKSDMNVILQHCEPTNFYISLTPLVKKARDFFLRGGELDLAWIQRMEKISGSITRMFLKKITHSEVWYYLYNFPHDGKRSLDQDFIDRSSSIQELVKILPVEDTNTNRNQSFLLMVMLYTCTTKTKFEKKDKHFFERILGTVLDDIQKKPASGKKITSRMVLKGHTPTIPKNHPKGLSRETKADVRMKKELIVARENAMLREGKSWTPTIDTVLQFEGNCYDTTTELRTKMTQANLLKMYQSFVSMLSLEVQMKCALLNHDFISEILKNDLSGFCRTESLKLVLSQNPHFDTQAAFLKAVIGKGCFTQISFGKQPKAPKDTEGKSEVVLPQALNGGNTGNQMTSVNLMASGVPLAHGNDNSIVLSDDEEAVGELDAKSGEIRSGQVLEPNMSDVMGDKSISRIEKKPPANNGQRRKSQREGHVPKDGNRLFRIVTLDELESRYGHSFRNEGTGELLKTECAEIVKEVEDESDDSDAFEIVGAINMLESKQEAASPIFPKLKLEGATRSKDAVDISMILELEKDPSEPFSWNLKYYYTLMTTMEQKNSVIESLKRQLMECVDFA